MVDINRGTSGITLPAEVSQEIWGNVQQESAVQKLARKVDLPGRGISIPVLTGDPSANWVSETAEKPVSRGTFATKQLTPYTLAVIVPFSNQFKRDADALYAECVRRLPLALAKKFDATVFASTGAPGLDFAQLGGATSVALSPHATDVKKGTYAGLVEAYTTVATNDGALNGWALSSQAKSLLLGQVDSTGRPLLLESMADGASVPKLLGEQVEYTQGAYATGTPKTIGFAGDWSQAVWGSVEGVQIAISDQATLTDGEGSINLFQQNMFAVRAEIEIGFQISNVNKFVKLTDAVRS